MTALVLLIAATAAAPVEVRHWSDANLPAGASLLPASAPGGGATLRIANPGPGPLRVTLAELPGGALTTMSWSVQGRVRTERVVGQGFLELWSHFPDGGAYFSRTLAPSGPMGTLEGTQGWREFTLPFESAPGLPAPSRLTVNLVLPGPGTVELGALELYARAAPAAASAGWLTRRQAGVAGGVAGCVLGLLGALVGVLSSRGRARAFVLGALATILAVGVAALGAAALALFTGQPREVWYPLALIGAISTIVPLSVWRATAARYRELELRRMRAIDV